MSDDDKIAHALRLKADNPSWGYIKIGQIVGLHKDKVRRAVEYAERKAAAPLESPPTTSGEFHALANLFPLIEGEEFTDLVADIKANGLHEPIVILDEKILDGRNRWRACEAAEVAPALMRFRPETQGQPLEFVLSKNLKRRHLNESQRAMVAARIANMGQGRPSKPANLPDIPQVPQKTAARRLSISERALRAARSVQEHAEPELAQAVDRGQLAVSAAATAAKLAPEVQREIAAQAAAGDANAARHVIKKGAREQREASLGEKQAAGNLALPNKRYGVILADPEWKFATWSENGMDRAADNHYATSETAKIAARPVADIAAKDCVLFLWATVPMLPHALHVMAAWGFEYKSHIAWDKTIPITGYWFRNRHELLLFGTCGDVPCPAPGEQWESLIPFRRDPKHSRKPDWQYQLIEAYFPHLPKIELNARDSRPGWDCWGAEAPNNAEAAE